MEEMKKMEEIKKMEENENNINNRKDEYDKNDYTLEKDDNNKNSSIVNMHKNNNDNILTSNSGSDDISFFENNHIKLKKKKRDKSYTQDDDYNEEEEKKEVFIKNDKTKYKNNNKNNLLFNCYNKYNNSEYSYNSDEEDDKVSVSKYIHTSSSEYDSYEKRRKKEEKKKKKDDDNYKRKMTNTEYENIKEGEQNIKKKKNFHSEYLQNINDQSTLNILDTNDEYTYLEEKGKKTNKNLKPVSKLDTTYLDKKNQEEKENKEEQEKKTEELKDQQNEKVRVIDIIENSKKILEKVPSSEEHIFNFPIEWNIPNFKNNISTKLKPWIYKKITEYIGADEKDIIEEISNYFVKQILNETSPKNMLVEAEKFLDSDGKIFILNMYKLIIFEQLKVQNEIQNKNM
ncbi:hypothetical protein PFAG_01310 [Plasmodium falciparum Santa Lucia]|nr:hypothetical protein PFAG_01310 [Plasmodium falciparum Santa Lucia]